MPRHGCGFTGSGGCVCSVPEYWVARFSVVWGGCSIDDLMCDDDLGRMVANKMGHDVS